MRLKILVTVKPQARKEGVKKVSEREYEAHVRAPARDGSANRALIELLAEHFAVPKSAIKIERGQFARKKLIQIDS
jgi:uncharacterized protein (TIGR00251 family)